jgi:hypothetical protein
MSDHDETGPQGIKSARVDGDEDVEGHSMRAARANEPDGYRTARIDGEGDDVEGHVGRASRADEGPDEFGRMRHSAARNDAAEDDVEGHFGQLRSPASRGE